jgi:poly(3-hydroxybutyrate) depolymerase
VYIVAQLVDTNKMPTSPLIRKYVQFAGRPDTTTAGNINNPMYGGTVDMWHWNITKGLKKVYESPY